MVYFIIIFYRFLTNLRLKTKIIRFKKVQSGLKRFDEIQFGSVYGLA